MKKITLLLSLAFVLISACMLYLVKVGVSLRAAPIINASIISADRHNMAEGIVYRLSPEFQNAQYVLWGFLPFSQESQKVFELLKAEYEKIFHRPVHVLMEGEKASTEEIRACLKPCWILLPKEKANELLPNDFINLKIRPLAADYFKVTWISFSKREDVPQYCIEEKRLTPECLRVLGIEEAQKKMKSGAEYFFMKKYKENDFFLFFQESPQL
ncbi:MAG: hypothetical protein ACXVB4_00655 [Pseudobdellovibrionaceae bacterium]